MKSRSRCLPLQQIALAVIVAATAYLCIEFTRETGRVAALWPANAIVLAAALSGRRRARLGCLVAGWAGCVSANLLAGDNLGFAAAIALINQAEVALCLAACLWAGRGCFRLHKPRHLLAFGTASALSPLASGAAAAAMIAFSSHADFGEVFQRWYFADALGLIAVTPALLNLQRRGLSRFIREMRTRRGLILCLVLAATLAAVFGQSVRPLPFLVLPALLIWAFQLSMASVAVALLVTSVAAIACNLSGTGPATILAGDLEHKLIISQLFLANASLVSLSVASVVADRRRAMAMLARQEAQLRELADSAPDLILHTRHGRIVYASPAARQFGYEPESLLGEQLDDYLHPDDLAAREAGDAGGRAQQRLRSADGAWIWVEANRRGLTHAAAGQGEVVTVLRDVTDRKALEMELAAARDTAEAAARVKSEFVANMSHEIRTPLTAILGFTSLLRSQPDLGKAAQSHIERVSGAGQALLALVNDVLDFSKLEAGQMSIKTRPAPLYETLADSIALFEPQAVGKGLTLELQVSGDLPVADIDPDRLRQVMLNLIGNAVKFTTSGGVTVTAAHEAARSELRVEVRDSGPGMTKSEQARLFQRFSQIDASSTRKHGGTGLGLAICRGLIEAMGGEIGVKSKRGQGSTFWFRIPAAVALGGDEDGATASVDLAGVRVLVADDNPVNRELVRLLLSSVGAEVTEAADGLEAVECAQAQPFDLILMDIRMPGCEGPDATLRIRNQRGPNREIPILAFTADFDLDRLGEQAGRGFNGVVHKPINAPELLEAIARHACFDPQAVDADLAASPARGRRARP